MGEISINENNGVKYFLDTNSIIDNVAQLDQLDKFYVSAITIEELEDIKTSSRKDDETKFKTRQAVRYLADNEDKFEVIPVRPEHHVLLANKNLIVSNDNLIIACASLMDRQCDDTVVLITGDLLCGIFAKNLFDLQVDRNFFKQNNEEYKGYKEIYIDTNINADNQWLANLYEKPENNPCDLFVNEYLIVRDKSNGKTIDILKWKSNELTKLKLPPKRVVQPLNDLQMCALDLLMDKDVPIKNIAGIYGSGKTLISTLVGLYLIEEKGLYSKLVLVRNNDLNDSGKDVGALPGDLLEKTDLLFKTVTQHFPQGEYQAEKMRMEGRLETLVTYFIKGLSINGYMLIDEAEDLTLKDIRLVGSRLEDDSCIVFSGDWKQANGKFKTDNGLIQLINQTKDNPLVGTVVLDRDVRSSASKVFADLM